MSVLDCSASSGSDSGLRFENQIQTGGINRSFIKILKGQCAAYDTITFIKLSHINRTPTLYTRLLSKGIVY